MESRFLLIITLAAIAAGTVVKIILLDHQSLWVDEMMIWPIWVLLNFEDITADGTSWLVIIRDPIYLAKMTTWLLFGNPYALAVVALAGVAFVLISWSSRQLAVAAACQLDDSAESRRCRAEINVALSTRSPGATKPWSGPKPCTSH